MGEEMHSEAHSFSSREAKYARKVGAGGTKELRSGATSWVQAVAHRSSNTWRGHNQEGLPFNAQRLILTRLAQLCKRTLVELQDYGHMQWWNPSECTIASKCRGLVYTDHCGCLKKKRFFTSAIFPVDK